MFLFFSLSFIIASWLMYFIPHKIFSVQGPPLMEKILLSVPLIVCSAILLITPQDSLWKSISILILIYPVLSAIRIIALRYDLLRSEKQDLSTIDNNVTDRALIYLLGYVLAVIVFVAYIFFTYVILAWIGWATIILVMCWVWFCRRNRTNAAFGESDMAVPLEQTGSQPMQDKFETRMPIYKAMLEQCMTEKKPFTDANFRLQDLMEHLPLNRSYLSRLFNDGYGISFYDYIKSKRVAYSKELIISRPDLSTEQIGKLSGFSSGSFFSRAFTEKEGISPLKYKKLKKSIEKSFTGGVISVFLFFLMICTYTAAGFDYKQGCKDIDKSISVQDSIAKELYSHEVKVLRSEKEIDQMEIDNAILANATLKIFSLALFSLSLLSILATVLLHIRLKKMRKMKDSIRLCNDSRQEKMERIWQKEERINETLAQVVSSADDKEKADELLGKLKSTLLSLILLIVCSTSVWGSSEKDPKADSVIRSIAARFDMQYGKGNLDAAKMVLDTIRQASYKYKTWNIYFRESRYFVARMASMGDIEAAKDYSNKIRREARRLKDTVGLVCAKMALSEAYYFQRDNAQARDILLKTLTDYPTMEDMDRGAIYMKLQNLAYNLGDYVSSLDYLKYYKSAMKDKANPIQLFVQYATIYNKIGDWAKMKESLLEAQKYYYPECFVSYFVNYHLTWAEYLMHTGEYSSASEHYQMALSKTASQPMLDLTVRGNYEKALYEAGQYEKSYAQKKLFLAQADSINKAFLAKQAEAIEANYRAESALLERTKNQNRLWILLLCTMVVIVALSIYVIIRKSYVDDSLIDLRRKLKFSLSQEHNASKFADNYYSNASSALAPILGLIGPHTTAATLRKMVERMQDALDRAKLLSALESGCIELKVADERLVNICESAVKKVRAKGIKVSLDNRVGGGTSATLDATVLERLLVLLMTPSVGIKAESVIVLKVEKSVLSIEGAYLSSMDKGQILRIAKAYCELFGARVEENAGTIMLFFANTFVRLQSGGVFRNQ
jgi:AraC-like DNA-binding protein/tetratricopeptide (TPR) repeat protein